MEIDPEDLAAWEKFNPSFDPSTLLQPAPDEEDTSAQGPGTNLADLILEKIAAHEAGHTDGTGPSNLNNDRDIRGPGHPDDAVELPTKAFQASVVCLDGPCVRNGGKRATRVKVRSRNGDCARQGLLSMSKRVKS